jgi:ATP-binding cassette subfamily B protein
MSSTRPRYDRNLAAWEASAIKNQVSLSMLNAGQGIIIASGVTLIMVLAASVVQHKMTVGDVVLVATFITQLYTPLNFLGFIYREIKHSLADIERMFGLLSTHQEVDDVPVPALDTRQAGIRFADVEFTMMTSAPFCTG